MQCSSAVDRLPVVSVVIPTYNRAGCIGDTLGSVLGQTLEAWEALVVDDGSDDGTFECVAAWAKSDRRIRLVRRERQPKGAATCRNIGSSLAKGEYLLFLDSDDLLAPTCLERRVSLMKQNPELDFIVFLTKVFYEVPGDGKCLWNAFTPESDLDRFLRYDQPWCTFGPLWKRASLGKVGLWDERARCAQDWEFHIRAVAAGLKYLKISEPDSFCRASRPGTIGSSWNSARHVCNRARLFKRIAACLHSRGLLTRRRRRIMAGELYQHAFRSGASRPLALKIWRAGWRTGIVSGFEFVAALSTEGAMWLTRRFNCMCERLLFPESQLPRTHLLATIPSQTFEAEDVHRGTETNTRS